MFLPKLMLLVATSTAVPQSDELYNLGVDAANGWARCLDDKAILKAQLVANQDLDAAAAQVAPASTFWSDAGFVALGVVVGAVAGVLLGVVVGAKVAK